MTKSTPTSTNSLKTMAKFLKNSEPEGYERFVKEFARYTDEITVAVTEAAPEDILNMQGQARNARAVLRMLMECDVAPKPFQPATQ